ncbi:MAG: methyltransferase domain-containing protein [Aquificae bacterium]|nr:methyltransferase domain-containing protein [Aquificota bacterium]
MKSILSLRFSRAVETYEEWAIPQRESARLLVEFVKPKGLVLDLGCGTGFVSEFLKNCKSVGLDLSPEMVKVYTSRYGSGVVGDAESLPFRGKSFDYVLSNFSLHWTDWKRSIREALRVARKGVGVAIPVEGSIPFSRFPFPRWEEVVENFPPEDFFLREIPIPFRGLDLVRFFHYTGTSHYGGKKKLLTRKELKRFCEKEKASFLMLFIFIRTMG